MESVQKTVDLADNALAAIYEITKRPSSNAETDDLSCLTQSICNTILSGSNENIAMEDIEEDHQPQKPISQFKTAAELLHSNMNQKQNNNSGYNSSGTARKLLGAKRRAFDRKPNESGGGYRDEGRDINTEFR